MSRTKRPSLPALVPRESTLTVHQAAPGHFEPRFPVNTFDMRTVLGGVEIRYGYWTGQAGSENLVATVLLLTDSVLRAHQSMQDSFIASIGTYGDPPPPVRLDEVTKDLPGLRLRADMANLMTLAVSGIGATVSFSWIDPGYLLQNQKAGPVRASNVAQLLMSPETMVHFVREFLTVAEEVIASVPERYPYLRRADALAAKTSDA